MISHASRTSAVALSVTLTVALALTGCGDKKSSSSAQASTSSTVMTTSTTTATSLTTPSSAPTPTSVAATSTMTHLTAVRVSANGAGDRVAFEFDKGAPGYSVTTTHSPIKSADTAVNISGDTVYLVKFATASDVDLSGGLKTYYNGAKDITPSDAKVVTEIRQVSDAEGVLTWAIGVSPKATLNVETTDNPAQVMIDLS